MSEVPTPTDLTYRIVRINWKSGKSKDFVLTDNEIFNLSTAFSNRGQLKEEGVTTFTLWYDSDLPEEKRKLSFITDLDGIDSLEVGDVEKTLKDFDSVDFKNFGLSWPELKKKLVRKTKKVVKKRRRKQKKHVVRRGRKKKK